MEGNEGSLGIVGDEDRVVIFVDIEQTRSKSLGYLTFISIRLHLTHLLDLLLLGRSLYLITFIASLQLLKLLEL